MRALRVAAIALLLVATVGCPSDEPATLEANDAGDHAWARQASLLLWGRMPVSVHETDVLVALVDQSDRAAVARAMTRSRDYRDRWQTALLDLMGVARQGNAANPGCYDLSLLETDEATLARFVADNAPTEAAFPVPFTQLDLLRSSLVADDLRPAFRANVFQVPWLRAPAQSLSEDVGLRRGAAEIFQSLYLGRDVSCLGCHNSEASVVDSSDPELDRHWPMPGHVERAVFGSPDGRPLEDMALLFRRRGVDYRHWFSKERPPPEPGAFSLLSGCISSNGGIGCGGCPCEEAVCDALPRCCTQEWDGDCAELCGESEACQLHEEVTGGDGCYRIQGLAGGCEGCSCEEFVCDRMPFCCPTEQPDVSPAWTDACAALCALAPDSNCAPHPDAITPITMWGWHASCGQYRPEADIAGDITGNSAEFIDSFDSFASIHDLEVLVAVGMDQLGSGPLLPGSDGSVDGPEALAWMMAAHFADRVWKKAMGRALTLPHGFSRNADQLEVLEQLTTTFVAAGWSLSELLVAIVTHPTFNQRAPEDLVAGSPYYYPRIFDPWTVEQDDPGVRPNSLGDRLHRRDGRQLQQMVRQALGWSKPENFFSILGVFDGVAEFDYQIGAFTQQSAPGHDSLGFQALLRWEDALAACRDPFDRPTHPDCEVREAEGCPECQCAEYVCSIRAECCVSEWGPQCISLCTNAGSGCVLVERPEGFAFQPDWVDSLAEAGRGGTWNDAVLALKERLLADPTLDPEEAGLYEDLIGASLDSPLPSDPDIGLRAVCGVLLSTPQFLLGGDPGSPEALDAAPVYPPGGGFQERCRALADEVFEPGSLTCRAEDLSLQ